MTADGGWVESPGRTWATLFRGKLSDISHVERKNDSIANGWGMAVHQRQGGGSWGWREEWKIIMRNVLIRGVVVLYKYSKTSGAHLSLD